MATSEEGDYNCRRTPSNAAHKTQLDQTRADVALCDHACFTITDSSSSAMCLSRVQGRRKNLKSCD